MFQVAAAYSIALDQDAEICISEQKTVNARKVFWRITQKIPEVQYIYREKSFRYYPIPYKEDMKIVGQFQSEKYFTRHEKEVRQLFAPSKAILRAIESKYGKFLLKDEVVSVNVQKASAKWLPSIKLAMWSFPLRSVFIVSSDDMPWCKKEMKKWPFKLIFSENNPQYFDFYLQSLCKHHIVSNTATSWWAAYLGNHPDKRVIAPSPWFSTPSLDTRDLIPTDWEIMTCSPLQN